MVKRLRAAPQSVARRDPGPESPPSEMTQTAPRLNYSQPDLGVKMDIKHKLGDFRHQRSVCSEDQMKIRGRSEELICWIMGEQPREHWQQHP